MAREKKYLKLEAGERKAVRQSGAMKDARKTGTKTNIYSGVRGSLVGTNPVGNDIKPITRNSKSTSVGKAKGSVTAEKTNQLNSDLYRSQGIQNQKEFEKTRLGARMIKKTESKKAQEYKAKMKAQGLPQSEYKDAKLGGNSSRTMNKNIKKFGSTGSFGGTSNDTQVKTGSSGIRLTSSDLKRRKEETAKYKKQDKSAKETEKLKQPSKKLVRAEKRTERILTRREKRS